MDKRNRIRIAGAALSLAVLFAGQVTAHADVTSDTADLATAGATNAVELAGATAANSTGDPLCTPNSAGGPVTENVGAAGFGIVAEDAAAASITCYSGDHSTYTLWTKLVIQDYNTVTQTGTDITGCDDAPGPRVATDGSVTVDLAVTCNYAFSALPVQHIHRALLRFNTDTGLNGRPTPSADVWPIDY